MPTEDTINLLKECDAGCKMGIDAIKQVIDKVENKKLYDIIVKYFNWASLTHVTIKLR